MADEITYRPLAADELARVGEIDRSERIDVLYVQHGTSLERRVGDWSAPPWRPDGDGEHSVAGQLAELERLLGESASVLGALAGARLVGIGVVVPAIRPGVAQLAFLHVSAGYRARGVGRRLADELERIAREEGDTTIVVSATPSENTVRFYLGRGYTPMAEPLPELFEREPEDVHMQKQLG